MNGRIRALALLLIGLFGLLFAQLNNVQLAQGERLREHELNSRDIVRDFTRPRGAIVTADGAVLARTIEVDSPLERLRQYPDGPLYAHLTGYLSLNFGAAGIEDSLNDELAGTTFAQQVKGLSDLIADRDRTATVTLSVDSRVQRAAADALGERAGSVVALEPDTGRVLAAYSWPTYDPNRLASHELEAAAAARQELLDAPDSPLLARFHRELFFPGSTFKTITAAAALDSGLATTVEPVFPPSDAYTPPLTDRPIGNFNGATCGGNLVEVFRVSCNTAFAELGVMVGAEQLARTAADFGFGSVPPLELADTVASTFPAPEVFERNTPLLAQAALGQFDVKATPLQMALVAAAVASGGDVPRPGLVDQVVDTDGDVLARHEAGRWRRALSAPTARSLQELMIETARAGTARRLLPEGVSGGGKTGTAQIGDGIDATHAWIIGFAPATDPQVAVAVIVEAVPGVADQTGGTVAAPVAQAVIAAALGR